MSNTAPILYESSDLVQIARHLASEMDDQASKESVLALKGRLIDISENNDTARVIWLKKLFCETPLMILDLTPDGVIRFFTFFLISLSPEIQLQLSQDARISLRTDVELAIKQIGEFLPFTPQQQNALLHLQALALSGLGHYLTNTAKQRDPAREKLSAALNIAERLVSAEPDNLRFMRTHARVMSNLGYLERDIVPATARSWFEKSARIRERLIELYPEDPVCMYQLANSYLSIGDLEEFSLSGQNEAEYLAWYWKSYLLYRRAVAAKPENENYHFALSTAYERFGNSRLQTEPAKALRWFQKSYAIRKRAFDSDRNSPDNLDNYWVVCNNLGMAYSALDDAPQACHWFSDGLKLAERLYSLDQKNLSYNGKLAIACRRLAEELEGCALPRARDLYVRSYTIINTLIQDGLRSIDYCRIAVSVLEGLERIDLEDNANDEIKKWRGIKDDVLKLLAEMQS